MPTDRVKPVYEQDAQYMLEKDVSAEKESVSEKKIADPSIKPEDQSVQSMLKKEPVSRKKIVDFNKPEDQGAPSMLKMDVAAKRESLSQKKIDDPSPAAVTQGVLEKTPSSVRKMISAFETGSLQKKGRRSLTRTRASKSQPNLVGIGGPLIDLDSEDAARPTKTSAPRKERTLNLLEPRRNMGKRGESSLSEQDIVGTVQPLFQEQLKQSSALSVPPNGAGSRQHGTLRGVEKESNTEGKSVEHLIEDCHIEVDDHQRKKSPSMRETTGKHHFFHRSDPMVKKEREKPQKPRKSEPESSRKNGSSGPVRQVIKIAVIVGFGIFVLLTRQKENRRGDRKSKDSFVSSPDFMNQLTPSEEQWSLLTVDGD